MPHVLIIEDDPDLRDLFRTTVELLHGFSVETAENGQAGLDRLRTRRPCVVVLDLMMPVMSGWEFRAQQLQDPAVADVPVLCVTAMFDAAVVSQRLQLPCMAKPVDIDHLSSAIAQACKGK
jgi:CheY-like chemotaxis protein